MANDRMNPAKAARPARASRKVYLGFWTKPGTKRLLASTADKRRQSVSALLDTIVEEYFVRIRMGMA